MKKLLSALLSLAAALSLTALPASALELEDAKTLLSQYYYNGVPEEVLELDSLDAILEALDDPYTYYMTPDNLQELPAPLAEYVRHYKQTFVTPVWFYEGHTIWGMTARAVEAFLKFFEA